MNFLTQILVWLNVPINFLGGIILSPIAAMPGWLSNTIISAIAGILLMIMFKHTSNQAAIGRVKDTISANLLALKLFRDSLIVTLKSQGQIFKASFLLLVFSIVPMLVMIVPVTLLLGQMGLWYQYRPLKIGEEAIVTLKLNSNVESAWPTVNINPNPAFEVIAGPVHILDRRELNWKIKTINTDYTDMVFQIDGREFKKQLAVGVTFMRLSTIRPAWRFSEILLNPLEKPFAPDSLVQSISIEYPQRISFTSGTDWWVIYFFAASMIFAFLLKPFLKVKI
jgi:hypothetical protein